MTVTDLNEAALRRMQHDVEAKIDIVLHTVRGRLAGHPLDVVHADLEARLAAAGVKLSTESIVPSAVGISALPRGEVGQGISQEWPRRATGRGSGKRR